MELTDTVSRIDLLCGGPPTETAVCSLCGVRRGPYYAKNLATAAIAAHYQLHHGDAFTSYVTEPKTTPAGVMPTPYAAI